MELVSQDQENFYYVNFDGEFILFSSIFFFTFLTHIYFENSKRPCIIDSEKEGFVIQIFQSFLHHVKDRLSWQQFFQSLYSANDLGNRERIRFIRKIFPSQSLENLVKTQRKWKDYSFVSTGKFKSKVVFSKTKAMEHDAEKHILEFHGNLFTLKSPNPLAPSMENFVKIVINEKRGRCLVVTKNVPLGSTLLVEAPFVACLDAADQNVISQRCYNCFQKLTSLKITCENCLFANFCGEVCFLAACSSYHKYECPCFPELHDIYRDIPSLNAYLSLVFRTICSLGPQKIHKLYKEAKTNNVEKNKNKNAYDNAIYASCDYSRILDLHQKIDPFSDWTPPLSFIILTEILKSKSSFFNELELEVALGENVDEFENFQEFVATLMLHNFESFAKNAFALFQPKNNQFIWPSMQWNGGEVHKIGTGTGMEIYGNAIYTTVSLINHSCLPNAVVSFESHFGTAVVTSLRDLRAGEELRISYGPIINSENSITAEERLEHLKQGYGFDCDCQGCSSGWPDMKFALDLENLDILDDHVNSDKSEESIVNFSAQMSNSNPNCMEKLAECRRLLRKSHNRAKYDANHQQQQVLSPQLLQIQSNYRYLVRVCVAMVNSNFRRSTKLRKITGGKLG